MCIPIGLAKVQGRLNHPFRLEHKLKLPKWIGLKKRQRDILQALSDLGGIATTRAIAEKVQLNVNGVSQSLSALDGIHVKQISENRGLSRWRLIPG